MNTVGFDAFAGFKFWLPPRFTIDPLNFPQVGCIWLKEILPFPALVLPVETNKTFATY